MSKSSGVAKGGLITGIIGTSLAARFSRFCIQFKVGKERNLFSNLFYYLLKILKYVEIIIWI